MSLQEQFDPSAEEPPKGFTLRKLGLLFAPVVLLALVLGLIACGGDGESDEDKILGAIETSATSTDPADCKELRTQVFLEQTEWSGGAEAFTDCEDEAGDLTGDPGSIEQVSNIEVNGSRATADIAFQGATFDGQTLSIALVEEDEDWKLDEVVGFAELHREKLAQSLGRWLWSGDGPQDAAVRTCIGEAFDELSRPQAEDALFGGGGAWRSIIEISEGCSQGS